MKRTRNDREWMNELTTVTLVNVLLKIKREHGLDAMLDYMIALNKYKLRKDPKMVMAVYKAMEMISVRRLYEDAIREKVCHKN